MAVTPKHFGERLAYARFLFHARHGHAPSNVAIGKATSRTGQAVGDWMKSATPPPDYLKGKPLHAPLASFLGVDQDWLISGKGEPPEPELWDKYVEFRAYRLGTATTKKRKTGT